MSDPSADWFEDDQHAAAGVLFTAIPQEVEQKLIEHFQQIPTNDPASTAMQIEYVPWDVDLKPRADDIADKSSQPDELDNIQPEPTPIEPELEEKLRSDARLYRKLEEQLQKSFYEQPEYYLLSTRWLKRWKVFVSYDQATNDKPSNKHIGAGVLPPINGDIVDRNANIKTKFKQPYSFLNLALRPGLKEHVDYVIISREMWDIFQYQNRFFCFKRFLSESLDGKKVEVYLFRINALIVYNQTLRNIQQENLMNFEKFQLQLPQYQPLSNDFIGLLSTQVKESVNENNSNPAGIGGHYSSYNSFSKDSIEIWVLQDDTNEKQFKNQMYRMCRASRSFNYKILFPGDYVDLAEKSLQELQINHNAIFVFELRQSQQEWCFHNKQHFITAKCDNCSSIEKLKFMCSCAQALYCTQECKNKDKYYHRQRCDRDAESSQEEKELVLTDKSCKGIVGLRNLGNTCFMNSGIQCITSIDALTDYFLQNKYVADINVNNPIGTKGELSKAYAKQMQKMWYGEENSLAPTDLKRAIGKFQPMFLGYDQHDSGELVSYLLDGLHEDLNRVKNKPYTQTKDYDGRPDEIIARESWEIFLKRNQSVIVDLMYGQYKSRLECPKCGKISITFDPFLMCALPIPQDQSKIFELLFLKDKINSVKMHIPYKQKTAPKIQDIINQVAKIMNVPNQILAMGIQYQDSKILDPNMLANEARKEYKHRTIIFRPIEPEESPTTDLPVVIMQTYCNSIYGNENYRKSLTKQRVYLFNPTATAKDIHDRLYRYFGQLLTNVQDYKRDIVDEKPEDQKWRILLVTYSSYETCLFCGKLGCENCELPYSDTLTIKELVDKCELFKQKHRLQIEIYYRKNAEEVERTYYRGESEMPQTTGSDNSITKPNIYDCFKLAETPEVLGEENAWYCPNCKQFVLASKQMQIYKAPKILILYFKRFKNKGYKGLYQSKLSTIIDFPIDDLDITKFVLNHQLPGDYFKQTSGQKTHINNHYSLFAISNHYGGLGGGHYTAYCCKQGSQWYQFDDSSMTSISSDRLVDAASYVLFYRRKD